MSFKDDGNKIPTELGGETSTCSTSSKMEKINFLRPNLPFKGYLNTVTENNTIKILFFHQLRKGIFLCFKNSLELKKTMNIAENSWKTALMKWNTALNNLNSSLK